MELQKIPGKIYELRNAKVMLDYDLAELYEIETKYLKRAVRNHPDRFPSDFMLELTKNEFENLRGKNSTSSHGGTRYMPYAFTEQGVAILSSVLNSSKAIEVNIAIVRTFVSLRKYALDYKDLSDKISKLEFDTNLRFKNVCDVLDYLINKDKQEIAQRKRQRIGFKK